MTMRNKPGKLIKELEFKEVGKDIFSTCKPGKAVKVDRHNFEPGNFIVWADKKRYAKVAGEVLHEYVEFK